MKEKLRNEILLKRNRLSPDEVERLSTIIVNRFMSLDFYQKSKSVMLYLDFRNEVKTGFLIKQMLHENKKVLIPVTNPSDYSLTVSELKDPKKDLFQGKFGLMEPNEKTLRPVDPKTIDVVIVPGLVFDKSGYRIGFGAGYYDRFLPNLAPHVPLISLAYELQVVDAVPKESHDVPVHMILTEQRIIRCK